MKKTKFFVAVAAMLFTTSVFAQQRGYHNAPYVRYEADAGTLAGGAVISGPTTNQADIYFDASERKAVNLKTGQSVEWTVRSNENDGAFNRMGIVIRYSVAGVSNRDEVRSANVQVYVNDQLRTTLAVDTRYSWEALWQYNDRYGNNNNISNQNWSMRFDEARYRVDQSFPACTKVRLVSQSNDLWIDFIEVESVPEPKTAAQQGATVTVNPGSNLQNAVSNNQGQTIYIAEGTHTVSSSLRLNGANTSIVGAGMWYSNIYFDRRSYDQGGVHLTNARQNIKDLSLNSNMKDRADGYKGIWGSTSNATIENVWITHFETGAWMASYSDEVTRATSSVTFKHCRFRNNYADGINLCQGSNNNVVEYSSFRSNCDDDMDIWPAGGQQCYNNTYRYCTAENNNRASSIALYGGYGNRWENIIIKDSREVAIRVNNQFDGAGFGNIMNVISNVSITRSGTNRDHFNNAQPVVDINSCPGNVGQIRNVTLNCIDIREFTNSAFRQNCNNVANIIYCGITVNGTLQHNNNTDCGTCTVPDIPVMGPCIVPNEPVTGVTFTQSTHNIGLNGQVNLANFVSVAPANAANRTVTYSIVNGGSFISLNANGTVTGTAEGQAVVEVKTNDGGFTARATINISNCSATGQVDLIVEDFTWTPANPRPGDQVVFTATVKNQGGTTIPAGSKLGLLFRISSTVAADNCSFGYTQNSNTYVWSDQNKGSGSLSNSIPPCGTIQLTINGGDSGNAFWTAGAVGNWIVCAEVNDVSNEVRLITESNYNNNFLTKTVAVSTSNNFTDVESDKKSIIAYGNTVEIRGVENGETVTVYNTLGAKIYSACAANDPELITTLPQGIYLVQIEGTTVVKKVLIVR